MSASTSGAADTRGLGLLWSRVTGLLGTIPMGFLLLIGRIAVASVFLKSGLNKIESWEVALQLFRQEYQVPVLPPELAAMLATSFELACSSLLIVWLFTRLATLPLVGMVFVIEVFVYPEAWTDHLMWFTLLLLILTRGPGPISLDAMLGALTRKRR
jgi:putative oxidoreductase